MRLAALNCVILACTVALAEEPRPRRHLHQIKELIVNKLFSSDCNCIKAPSVETQFYEIPGFKDVVIKAVPKEFNAGPTPVNDKLPPNSHVSIVGSYLGTRTLNETYNALLGVKNLLTSGILAGKPEVLQEVGLDPSKVHFVAKPLNSEPVRVLVQPPRVPIIPTQYSYKQINQDGSLTTYTSSLDLKNGVSVIEDGKAVPFFIDRVKKIPVHLPVPVLPEVSNIILPGTVHPAPYSYQLMYPDGRMGLPSLISQPGPLLVTEMSQRIPPPPVFLMDRIEKVAAIAAYPRVPFMQIAPMPVEINSATQGVSSMPGPFGYSYSQMNINGGTKTHSESGANKSSVPPTDNGLPKVPLNSPNLPQNNPFKVPAKRPMDTNAAAIEGSVQVPGPYGYSYSQMDINGGVTTHPAFGENKSSVLVTENGLPKTPLHVSGFPVKNPFYLPAGYGTYSYVQVHGDDKTRFNVLGVPGPVNVVEHKLVPVSPGIPFPHSTFSYKQIGDGKTITYTGSGSFEEDHGIRPVVVEHGMTHPIPPPHIVDRIEKVAAGAKYNQPPFLPMPVAVPVLTGSVDVPPVYSSPPQRTVKIPTTPEMNSFVYKHIHNDGSVTSYGSNGSTNEDKTQSRPIDMDIKFPQGNVRVFESPMYGGPILMNPVNPNTIKPSTPVSGYSYKLVNSNFQGSHPPVGPVDGPFVDTFAPPSLVNMPTPIQGCTNHSNSAVHIADPLAPVPLTYSYKQISHSNPDPFLLVKVEDPARGINNSNAGRNQNNQAYPSLPPLTLPANPFPTVNSAENKPEFEQRPFVSASVMKMPGHQRPATLPTSSFSYKEVYQRQASSQQPEKFNMPVPQVTKESSSPSSFSYKQVTSQAFQPLTLPSPQPVIEELPNGLSVPPPKINTRGPEVQKDRSPSSFSYKQVTSHGIYEYSDEFPTGVRTNLPLNVLNPYGNPSGHVFDQQPLPASTIPTPMPEMPTSTFKREDSLANNPIIVPDTSSRPSFSFRSANPDGSTITVKDDGRNSIAVHVEESPKTEASQQPTNEPAITDDEPRVVPVLKGSVTTLAPEQTTGPVSEHAPVTRPMRRRIVKRVKHRGDIPDDE